MRIIAGSAKNRRLTVPRGVEIRPTSEIVREALFNSLGPLVLDAVFADLYAGCGSVGLEALSRGAAACIFVERHPRCVQALRSNLENTALADRARVLQGDCLQMLEAVWQAGPPDIVFLDPPYTENPELVLAGVLRLAEVTRQECLVIVQCAKGQRPSLPPAREKTFGDTRVLFYEYYPQ